MLRKVLIICALIAPDFAISGCLTGNTGAGCVSVPVKVQPQVRYDELPEGPVEIGSILPRGEYSMLMNARYYGLPPVENGWVYFRVENDVYRVDFDTREVLDRATDEANTNLR